MKKFYSLFTGSVGTDLISILAKQKSDHMLHLTQELLIPYEYCN